MINFKENYRYSAKNSNGEVYEFILDKLGRRYLYGYIEYTAFNRYYITFNKDSLFSEDGAWEIEEELGYRKSY